MAPDNTPDSRLCLLLENPDTGGKPVQKIACPNRANFPVTEKTGERYRPCSLGDHPAIMVWFPVEVRAPAITGEQ
jgi:hypothetical protein